jgi:death-on-curing protein
VNRSWVWLDPKVLLAVHEEQLAEHGGAPLAPGIWGCSSPLLARPRNLALYGQPDIADLAAAYGCGIARNHPFIDGNKRTAFVAVELFLLLNEQELVADDADCVLTMLAVAAGSLDEAAFAAWLRAHSRPR